MEAENYIAVKDFCERHNLKEPLILAFDEYNLIHLNQVGEEYFMLENEIEKVERMVRLCHEFNISLDDKEVVYYLMRRVIKLQCELMVMKKRLGR